VQHAATITIKRLDDELRVANLPGAGSPEANLPGENSEVANTPGATCPQASRPLSDREWFASLRFAVGDGRHALLRGSLQALANPAPANVFLRLGATPETIAAIRACLQSSRSDLARRSQFAAVEPAAEARQFPSLRLARQLLSRRLRLPDWLCLVAMLEEFAEEWDNPQRITTRPTDTITARDGWRCTAPGCMARVLEVHHIVYQSRGGSDDPSNLTSLCPFHHRMGEHGTLARVTGTAPLGLQWQLGVQALTTRWSCERALM
jgi:hypothetical protein